MTSWTTRIQWRSEQARTLCVRLCVQLTVSVSEVRTVCLLFQRHFSLTHSLSLSPSRSLYIHTKTYAEDSIIHRKQTPGSSGKEVKEFADSPSTLDTQARRFASVVWQSSLPIQISHQVTLGYFRFTSVKSFYRWKKQKRYFSVSISNLLRDSYLVKYLSDDLEKVFDFLS